MGSSEPLSSPQSRASILLSRKRLLVALIVGLVAIVLSYLLGQAHTTDEFVTQYVISAVAMYAVLMPFSALR